MKLNVTKTWSFELNEDELRFLMGITQNYMGNPEDESEKDKKMRTTFFVNAARALGYDMKDDGSMNRSKISDNISIDIF